MDWMMILKLQETFEVDTILFNNSYVNFDILDAKLERGLINIFNGNVKNKTAF